MILSGSEVHSTIRHSSPQQTTGPVHAEDRGYQRPFCSQYIQPACMSLSDCTRDSLDPLKGCPWMTHSGVPTRRVEQRDNAVKGSA